MTLTNEEWTSAVKTKISSVHADSGSSSFILPAVRNPAKELGSYIDHTLLKPDATPAQINKLCDEAIQYKFKSCCVNGVYARRVAQRLEGSQTLTCAVIGFPLGAAKSSVKAFEAKEAVADGAKEIDMVLNVGALKAGAYNDVYDDIQEVVKAAGGNIVKVILETVFLSDDEKIAASYIAAEAGAKFVKTCTGFCGGGASVADVTLMKRTVMYKNEVKVKASAGIRSFEQCLDMLNSGAERIGTSSGVAIMEKAYVEPGTY